jgi:pimeloyl-ACP methyl ester carboxylesterase
MATGSIDFEGCRLAFDLAGAGPPVILIQGVGVCGTGWLPQVEGLSGDFQCMVFDNRGIGRSRPLSGGVSVEQMARDALHLMSHVGWQSAHVVGHSLGGLIALQLALAEPERVRSLSLLCTVGRGRDATRLTPRMLKLGLLSRVGPRPARRRAFMRIVMPDAALAGIDVDAEARNLERLFGHDIADQPRIVFRQLRALRAFDATSRLGRLADVPTLVCSAAHDPIAPPRFGRALARAVPGARYEEFAAASHGMTIHCADRVNALLRDHMTAAEARCPDRL